MEYGVRSTPYASTAEHASCTKRTQRAKLRASFTAAQNWLRCPKKKSSIKQLVFPIHSNILLQSITISSLEVSKSNNTSKFIDIL